MGFLSQLVGAVVDAVEGATGNEDSEAGNALEQQATAVEHAASDAADAAAEAAAEAAGLIGAVVSGVDDAGDSAGGWVVDNLRGAGIQVPNKLDLNSTINLVASIGELTGRKVTEKVERVTGPAPIRLGQSLVSAVIQDGPSGAFNEMKRIVTDTVNADGQIRQWISRVGGAMEEASPVEKVEQMFRGVPDAQAAILAVLRGISGGGEDEGKRKKKSVTTLATRAEEERRRMIEELRRAAGYLERSQPKSPCAVSPNTALRPSRTPEGIELQRLIPVVMRTPIGRPSLPDLTASRHLAAAVVAAVRSALLLAQLQLWLTTIARLARLRARSRGPSLGKTAAPSSGSLRSSLQTVLPRLH